MTRPHFDAMVEAHDVLIELAHYLARVESINTPARATEVHPDFPKKIRDLAAEIGAITEDMDLREARVCQLLN